MNFQGSAQRDEVEKTEGIVGGKRRGRKDAKRGSPRHPSKGETVYGLEDNSVGKYKKVLHHLLSIICVQGHLIIRLFSFR